MRYNLVLFLFLLLGFRAFAQLDSSLERKLTISGFCLCKTTVTDLKAVAGDLKEISVEEMDVCNDGFTQDSRFENRKGYYSEKFPGIIFQKDDENYI
ncbi:MAG TPA: hypothetical protein VGQ53_11765, partial [Chitinophagaceae bacterium]|nr:hypothetical protein [Chitinophagaceae bacterium]